MVVMKINEEEILQDALSFYGAATEIKKAIEECNELATALCHLDKENPDIKEVIHEIADVEVMCKHLRNIFGSENVQNAKNEKLLRLKERIKRDRAKQRIV